MDTVRALLRGYPFQNLSPAELHVLAPAAVTRDVARGAHVFRAGDPATELYVVASGQLKEYGLSREGNELIFEVFVPGATFGEPGLFAPERTRAVNVAAMEPSTVIAIRRDILVEFLFKHPPAMMQLLQGLSSEVRRAADDLLVLAYDRVRDRVVGRLLELAESHGEPVAGGVRIVLHLSQTDLSATVGASRAKVNRALADLANAGAVTLGPGRRFTVDIPSLRRLGAGQLPLLHQRNRDARGR